jgi:hypothetical protein
MTIGTPQTIPAGWYEDPADQSGERWWDGTAWTHAVRHSVLPPVPVFAGEITTATVPPLVVEPAYVPFQSETAVAITRRGTSQTRSSWWIALYPIWALVPQVVLVIALGVTSPLILSAGIGGINFVAWLVLLRLAFADRSTLISAGNASAGSPFWMVLSPLAYMVARSIHVRHYDSGGWTPLIWMIIASFIAPPLAVLGIFAVLGVLPV